MAFTVYIPSIALGVNISPATKIGLGVSSVQSVLSKSYIVWSKPNFEINLPKRNFIQECIYNIETREFESAINIVLSEIYEYSKIFGTVFGKFIEDKIYIPQLIEELKAKGIVSDADWNRLATLLMVLDGIDVEVHESGGELNQKDLEYALEYVGILRRIMTENQVYIGTYTNFFTEYVRNVSHTTTVIVNVEPCIVEVNESVGRIGEWTSTNSSNATLFSDNFTNFRLSE